MDLTNATKNQHYLPQVEQRLNATNPEAPPSRQRIYSFEVMDRERLSLRLESPKGRLISESLAIRDLFSFDVAQDKKSRVNFEPLFGHYEATIRGTTLRLLDRLEAVGPVMQAGLVPVRDSELYQDLVELFTAKLLNFARNPHSIRKVLNTFGSLADYEPTAPHNREYFERILNGRKPHQQWLCAELGITEEDYIRWLKMLFMLFIEYDKDNNSMLSGVTKALFESTQHIVSVMVCTYVDQVCLVSDRAFSTNIRKDGIDAFDFNLCSRAFIRYTFGRLDALVPQAPRALIDGFRRPARELMFYYQKGDLDLLCSFNTNVIYQSAQRVYSAIKDPVIRTSSSQHPRTLLSRQGNYDNEIL